MQLGIFTKKWLKALKILLEALQLQTLNLPTDDDGILALVNQRREMSS